MASIIELEVTAAAAEGSYTVRVVRPASDEHATTTMQLDAGAFITSRDDLETAVLASAVAGRRILSPGEQRLRTVGTELFDALFSGPVGETYRASANAANLRGERLQVVLRLDVPGLAAIPWESMYDRQNDEYIGLTDPVIRHIPSADAEPLAIVAPLKVLVLVASPDGMTALDVESERTKLSQALAEPIADGRIQLKWLMQASWEQVQDELLSGTWHVLHFIGHGDYDRRTDQGVIALVGDDGGTHLVEADRLARLLNEARPTPMLVVLNSCQSGRSGTQDLFSSTAATLVRQGISAAAAMQFSISDAGATKFARGLYSALASGRSIGDAMGSGRVGLLSTPGSLEWVTPVLYVRGDTSTLFTITAAPAPAAAPADVPTRTGPNKKMLAIIGAIAAAVVVGVVILVILLNSSDPKPPLTGPTTTPAVTSPTTSTSEVVTPPPSDADTLIRTLAAAGIDNTLRGGNTELARYLANSEYTVYPAVASALLDAIGTMQLRQPVAIDAIVFDYEVFAGAPPPNRADLVDADVLKRSVAYEYMSRYGGGAVTFESLLVRR
ncbi:MULTISPECIES: CHAT domain-containing protein [unclassified Mycobacterium]|uniref:CHAT domain-containing protein n=1 Tax=unclassified Mycobacterium TaxID=2642494 RepID=UPI0029C7EAAF|nr:MULTISPECIES: CHAT domain-containing protein [unclassified Mycobacterium]